MAGITTAMTSSIHAKSVKSTYPIGFHTMPDMEHHLGKARNASGAIVLAYSPLVASNQLDEWANYSETYQYWIAEVNILRQDYNAVDPIMPNIWHYPDSDETHAYLKECKFGAGIVVDQSMQQQLLNGSLFPTESSVDDNIDGGTRNLEQLNGDLTPEVDPRVPLLRRDGPFSPIWTYSPGPSAKNTVNVNHDLFDKPNFESAIKSVSIARQPMFLDVCNLASWFDDYQQTDEELQAVIAHPVYESFEKDAVIVGNMIEILPWRVFFERTLNDNSKPILAVLRSSCGQEATFRIRGANVTLLAEQDVHDPQYNHMAIIASFAEFANPPELIELDEIEGVCSFTMIFYPNKELEEQYLSTQPLWFAMIVLGVFFVTSILFFLFDRLQTRQRDNIIQTAKKQNIIVSSLFPKSVQAKILEQVDAENDKLSKVGKAGLRQFMSHEETNGQQHEINRTLGIPDKSKPIADLFPETTIMFADIAG